MKSSKKNAAAGGLQTDALNYARFLTAIMNRKVLTQQSLNEMLKKQVELPDEDLNAKVIGATHWSLGFGNEYYQLWYKVLARWKQWEQISGLVSIQPCKAVWIGYSLKLRQN